MIVHSIKLSVACFLLLGMALIFASEEAEAIDPEWSYETGDNVYDVAISADGEYIAAGSTGYDNKLYLFDKDSSTPLWSYGAGNIVNSVAISADGEYVVAGSWDKKIYLFDKDSDTPLWHYTTDGELYSVAISADGEYIAAGNHDDEFYLFDKDSNTPLWTYSAGDAVYSVSISADGEYIAVGSFDGKVYLFDKDSSTPLWSYSIGGEVWSVSISADGEYIAAGGDGDKVYLFDMDSPTPIWNYDTGEDLLSVEISADGEYIVAGGVGDDWKVYFFNTGSSTPLWSYTAGNIVSSVDISANGDYVTAGSNDNKIYLFGKDSSTPLGSYTAGDDSYSVAISDSGQHFAAGSYDDKVYTFKNSFADSFSLTLGGPADNSQHGFMSVSDLSWSVTSNGDDEEYTFDLYLGTLNVDLSGQVLGTTVLENTQPSTEKVTDIHYYDGHLFFSELDGFSIKKINLENDEISVFATDNDYLKYVFDITIDDSTGNVYTISRPSGTNSYTTRICEWLADGTLSGCYSGTDVRYGTSIEYYSGSIFALQTSASSSYKKVVVLNKTENSDIDEKWEPVASYPYNAPLFVNDMVIDQNTGDIWLVSRDINGTIIKLDASENYEQTASIKSYTGYSISVSINEGYLYTAGLYSTSYYGGIKRMDLSGSQLFEDVNYNFTYFHYLGQMAFDDDDNLYISTDYRYSYSSRDNFDNFILKLTDKHDDMWLNIDSLAFEFDTAFAEDLTNLSFDINSEIMADKTYYWQVVATDSSGNLITSPIRSFYVDGLLYPPVLSITGPPSITDSHSADFFLSSTRDGLSFSCKLDNEDWFNCGTYNDTNYESPNYYSYYTVYGEVTVFGCQDPPCGSDYEYLWNGNHSFAAYATTIQGEVGPISYWNWTISVNETDDDFELPEWGFSFEIAAEYDTDGKARDVSIRGDSALIADYDEGFLILDISDVSDINELDRYKQPGFIYSSNIEVIGNTVFVAASSQISIYDIANPSDIIEVGEYDEPDATPWYGITVIGNLAYVAAGAEGLFVLDISDITNITILDIYNTDGVAADVLIVGDFAYVSDNANGLVVLDISNPSDVQYVNNYNTDGFCRYVTVDDDGLAYVAAGEEGLLILDISNPEEITLVGSYDTDGDVLDIVLVGKYVIIADNTKGALALDVSDPTNPEFVTSYNTDGDAWGVDVTKDYVYVADYSNGLVVLEIVPNEVEEIPGCMDDNATNYNLDATVDDGSCEYEEELEGEIEFPWSYFTGHEIWDIVISDNSEYVAVSSDKLYLFRNGMNEPLWIYNSGDIFLSVDISEDGSYIVAGDYGKNLYLFNKNSSVPLWSYNANSTWWFGLVSISSNGNYVTASDGKFIYFFHKSSNIPIWYRNVEGSVMPTSMSSSGEYVFSSPDLIDSSSGDTIMELSVIDGQQGAISANGGYIVIGNDGGDIYLFDTGSNTPLWTYNIENTNCQASPCYIRSVAISDNGEYMVVGFVENKESNPISTVYLFQKDDFNPVWSYDCDLEFYRDSLAISADGAYITVGGSSEVYLFGKDSNIPIWSYTTEGEVRVVDISPNGDYIVAGSTDTNVYSFNYQHSSESEYPDSFESEFYYIPSEGTKLSTDKNVTFGLMVNRAQHDYQDSGDSLLDLYQNAPTFTDFMICLPIGSPQEVAIWDFIIENQLYDVNLLTFNTADFSTGQANFMSEQCTIWMAPYDQLVDFNNTHPVEFERMILPEMFDITPNMDNSKYLTIIAQYEDYPLYRTNRQPVDVGNWELVSPSDSVITIENASFWWRQIEDDYDPDCVWNFTVYLNGELVAYSVTDLNVQDCSYRTSHQEGQPHIDFYDINISTEVSEGDIISIFVTYEGWSHIELYYGNMDYSSGFYISGLELPEPELIPEPILGCTNLTANNHNSEATEDDGSCLFDEILDDTSATDGSGEEASFSLPDNTMVYGLVTFTIGALIAAGLAEAGARNSIPQIVEGLQNLLDAGITDSEINEALLNLENIDGLNYFSEDRTNALDLLENYESTTGSALDSMNQLNELQNLVNELEEAGVSSPELEAEIADIESMITSQLEGDTSKDYSKSVWERHRKD